MEKPSNFFVRKHQMRKNTCFVLMPLADAMSAVYEHGIKPLVESMGLQCKRADELYTGQSILGDIWQSIQTAEIVIADLTGKNPNVMYELGLSHILWKKVILLSQNKDDVPFDLRAWRVLWYDFTFAGAARLKDELKRAIESMLDEPNEEPSIIKEIATIPIKPPIIQPPVEGEWKNGVVRHFNSEKYFGYIASGEENFYFIERELYISTDKIQIGDEVIFKVADAINAGKNRRAITVFKSNTGVIGELAKVVEKPNSKPYGFCNVKNKFGEMLSLFIVIDDSKELKIGDSINILVKYGIKGPIGQIIHSDK